MAKKANADGSPRRKKTFGGANLDRISPPLAPTVPKALNCVLSFEEALKLHLSLGQLLGHLNGYDRATKAGRRSAVNLCIYTGRKRIVVVEGKTGSKAPTTGAPADGQASS